MIRESSQMEFANVREEWKISLSGGRAVDSPIGRNEAVGSTVPKLARNLQRSARNLQCIYCSGIALHMQRKFRPNSFPIRIHPCSPALSEKLAKLPISSLTHTKIPSSVSVICASI